ARRPACRFGRRRAVACRRGTGAARAADIRQRLRAARGVAERARPAARDDSPHGVSR
ncbi:MAG: hypothetical protein AVDCRST_MAG67-4500, partial [uncultured Solirubrobacteraceae bacterium]